MQSKTINVVLHQNQLIEAWFHLIKFFAKSKIDSKTFETCNFKVALKAVSVFHRPSFLCSDERRTVKDTYNLEKIHSVLNVTPNEDEFNKQILKCSKDAMDRLRKNEANHKNASNDILYLSNLALPKENFALTNLKFFSNKNICSLV